MQHRPAPDATGFIGIGLMGLAMALRLRDAGLPVFSIQQLYERALEISGQPSPIDFLDKVVGVVRYRDGTVIDLVHQIKPLA